MRIKIDICCVVETQQNSVICSIKNHKEMRKSITQEMDDWYQKNTSHIEKYDKLEHDIEMDRIRQDFFDTFEDELKDVDIFDVWNELF